MPAAALPFPLPFVLVAPLPEHCKTVYFHAVRFCLRIHLPVRLRYACDILFNLLSKLRINCHPFQTILFSLLVSTPPSALLDICENFLHSFS